MKQAVENYRLALWTKKDGRDEPGRSLDKVQKSPSRGERQMLQVATGRMMARTSDKAESIFAGPLLQRFLSHAGPACYA